MSEDEIRRIARAVVAEIQPQGGEAASCWHGITTDQAASLKGFADFWKSARATATKSAVGFIVTVLLLAVLAGFGIATRSLLAR